MEPAASQSTSTENRETLADRYLLSVDGAGVFLLILADEVTLGGYRPDDPRADVCLMADLSRQHLTLSRSRDGYVLKPHGSATWEDGRELPPDEPVPLGQSAGWSVGENIEIRFRQPTVLSLTAVLDFPSSHRPLAGPTGSAVDGVILMDQNCLIRPGSGQHVSLGDGRDGVILYRSKGRLWCKSKTDFRINDEVTTNNCALKSGDGIAGDDFRFRIEAV